MNGSALARFGIGGLIACCVAPAAALADTPTLNPSGTLTFSWQGDPARGCQAAGVCGVSGSLEVIPVDQSGSSESPPSHDIQIQDDGAVVRVTDPGSTPSEPHICTQLMPVAGSLTVTRRHSGGLRGVSQWFSVPSSGDCAGPLADSFSAFSIPARRLPGRTEAYDLSGSETFGSGPYTVTLKSTIRARRPTAGLPILGPGGGGSPFPVPKSHKGLVERVSVQYRMTVTGGPFTTTFAGRPDPFCVPLDACGASGVITDTVSGTSNQLEFDGQRVVKRRVSGRAALAELRSGRLAVFDAGALLANAQSASFSWPDGSACTDRLRQLNAVSLNTTGTRHKRLLLTLATNTEDPFRSICPGPGAVDVLGSSDTLAKTSLPLSDLGRRSIRISLSGTGRFVASSYAGFHSGGVTVALRLVRLRAGTKAEDVFPGEP